MLYYLGGSICRKMEIYGGSICRNWGGQFVVKTCCN